MGVSSDALSLCLLSDLQTNLNPDAFARIQRDEEWPGMSYREYSALSIKRSLLRKVETSMTDTTKAAALEKFLQVNQSCKDWTLCMSEFGDDILVAEFKMTLYRFWHKDQTFPGNKYPCPVPIVDHPYELLDKGRVGPGSSVGASGGDFYTKFFSSKLTCTSRYLYEMYKRYIRGFPEWNNAENIRIQHFGEAYVVEGNRLDFVPKNDDISRSICIEPSLNMFFQLGFAEVLNSRLVELWGLDFQNQQYKNRELARKGSLDSSFSTIDLSSASDSISISMLREVLPPDFLRWLMLLRSSTSKLPNGRSEMLGMISTMGNGYTFPLQTILFTSIVLSAMRLSGVEPLFPRGNCAGNFGVYGDDIICPSVCTQKVLRLLKLLGFTPNADKTFVEGPFRESCGADFFQGVNVRGVYLKRVDTKQDFYSAINQLNLFSTRTGIRLPKLVQLLLKYCRYQPVPRYENDDSGIKVPMSILRKPFRLDKGTGSILYYRDVPRALKIRIGESALFIPRRSKPRIYNPSGLFIAFLQGAVNSHTISIRQDRVTYERKSRVSPNWDATPTVHPLAGWFNWQRWDTAVYLNLFG